MPTTMIKTDAEDSKMDDDSQPQQLQSMDQMEEALPEAGAGANLQQQAAHDQHQSAAPPSAASTAAVVVSFDAAAMDLPAPVLNESPAAPSAIEVPSAPAPAPAPAPAASAAPQAQTLQRHPQRHHDSSKKGGRGKRPSRQFLKPYTGGPLCTSTHATVVGSTGAAHLVRTSSEPGVGGAGGAPVADPVVEQRQLLSRFRLKRSVNSSPGGQPGPATEEEKHFANPMFQRRSTSLRRSANLMRTQTSPAASTVKGADGRGNCT